MQTHDAVLQRLAPEYRTQLQQLRETIGVETMKWSAEFDAHVERTPELSDHQKDIITAALLNHLFMPYWATLAGIGAGITEVALRLFPVNLLSKTITDVYSTLFVEDRQAAEFLYHFFSAPIAGHPLVSDRLVQIQETVLKALDARTQELVR